MQAGVVAPDLSTPKVADLDKLLSTTGVAAVVQSFGVPSALAGWVPSAAEAAAADAQLNPELGPLDAMRMRLVPEWETMTKQLAKLNGNLQASTWAERGAALSRKELPKNAFAVRSDLAESGSVRFRFQTE